MKKIHIQARRVYHRLTKPRDGTGFSMLEAVVVVGVLLALGVGGLFAYGPIVKNAKLAKVKSAVSEVYTAVTVAQIDGDPTTSPKTVVDTYNGTSDSIKFRIKQGYPEPVVAAMSTEEDYIPQSDNDFCLVATLIKDESITAEQGACKAPEAIPETPSPTVAPAPTPTPTPPYVDPMPAITKLTYKCDVNTIGFLPMYQLGSGSTETWSDGVVKTYPTGSLYSSRKTLTAGTTYTATIDGTYNRMNASTDLSKCLRSVDHWGSNTGVVSAKDAFSGAINLTSIPAHIPSTITDMQSMFSGATSFNDPNIGQWNVSNVTQMTSMFEGATSFNQSLNNWNVSNLNNAFSMFKNAANFNQPLNNWNVKSIVNMGMMFSGATSFNQDLASWNTEKVKTMAYMFDAPHTMKNNVKHNTSSTTTTLTYRCDVNTLDFLPMYQLGSDSTETWNDGQIRSNLTGSLYSIKKLFTAGVTYTVAVEGTYNSMGSSTSFSNCLRSVDHWGQNTGVVSSQNAFKNAINLTKVPDSVPNTITNMNSMFYGASNFNQNLSGWSVGNVTTRTDFSTGSGLTSVNLPLFK